jgi:predicted MFS family arabinose efflux permease
MAFIGISIGASFVVSLIAGPSLDAAIGVRGIFWVMAAMAIVSLILLKVGVRTPGAMEKRQSGTLSMWRVLWLPQLRGYFMGVFALHFILSNTFLAVPQILVHSLNIPKNQHWQVYLGVFAMSLLGTYGFIRQTERTQATQRIVITAILLAAGAQALLAVFDTQLWPLLAVFAVFFAAFNFLESSLPTGLSRAAPPSERGAALGIFATLQSLATFAGSLAGGQLAAHFGYGSVFWLAAGMGFIWAMFVAIF